MNDEDYYCRRADTQLKLAQRATVRAVAGAHYRLANLYLDLANVRSANDDGPAGSEDDALRCGA